VANEGIRTEAEYGSRMPGRFLTLDEVAEELAVTKTQVYTMVRKGELTAIRIGTKGHWRVERAKLEAYIAAQYEQTAEYVRNNPLADSSD
jgi:excisionase family DNA binding protein